MRSHPSRWAALSLLLLVGAGVPRAQQSGRALEGMWSDPPVNPDDFYCFAYCTDVGLDHLDAALDDPANDDKSFFELRDEGHVYAVQEYIRPRLSMAALQGYPLDELDDPGYLYCEPWGFARQVFAPHQLEIKHQADRIEMRYGEWEAKRTIYLEAGKAPKASPPRPLGYSVGHYEGDTLVIETSGISANITFWRARHSDQLKVTERYVRDGDRLLLTATMQDPWGLREPLELKKVWSWAPDQQIFPYADCEPAGESAAGRN